MWYLPLILSFPCPWGTFGLGSSSVSRNEKDSYRDRGINDNIQRRLRLMPFLPILLHLGHHFSPGLYHFHLAK
jgi:hypothetical protein